MTRVRDQLGASTAEYAIGTVAAAGFASMLLMAWPWLHDLISYCLFCVTMLVDRVQLPVIPT